LQVVTAFTPKETTSMSLWKCAMDQTMASYRLPVVAITLKHRRLLSQFGGQGTTST